MTETGPAQAARIIPKTISESDIFVKGAKIVLFSLLNAISHKMWCKVARNVIPIDGDDPFLGSSDEFNVILLNPFVHKLLDSAVIGLKPINAPREQDPENPEKEFICVEWRYLPKHVAEAFASGEGARFLKETPGPGKPAAVCQMNLQSDELAGFLERHLEDPRGEELGNGFPCVHLPSGRRIESGMRFQIPVYKKYADKTFCLLELSWLARLTFSISGDTWADRYHTTEHTTSTDVDWHPEMPDSDWKELLVAVRREAENDLKKMMTTGREGEAEAAQSPGEDPAKDEMSAVVPRPATRASRYKVSKLWSRLSRWRERWLRRVKRKLRRRRTYQAGQPDELIIVSS